MLKRSSSLTKSLKRKSRRPGGSDVRSEVLDAVAEKIPLDGEETQESVAIINQIKQKVRQEYPLSDQELTERYMPKAESLYPVYKQGDNANIIFLLHGKQFYASGPYYRSDSTYVWVGSKKILKSTIPSDYACRFDVKLNEAKRNGYVNSKIYDYHRRADSFEQKLLAAQHDNIEASRNKFKINGKWQTARAVTEQKYAAASSRQDQSIENAIKRAKHCETYAETYRILESLLHRYPNHKRHTEITAVLNEYKEAYSRKTEEVKNMLAYCSQPQIDPQILKNRYGADLLDVRLLSKMKTCYRDIPDSGQLLTALDQYQQVVAGRIIEDGLKRADAAQTYQETFQILRNVINSCPEHTPALSTVRSRLQNLETQFVEQMISKAKETDSYDKAFEYLNAARQCKYASNRNDAVALYNHFQQELEEKRQAQARRYSSSSGSGRVCAECRGSGKVEFYYNGRWYQRVCGECRGSGDAGFSGEYIDRNGRHRSQMDQMLRSVMGGGGIF